MDRLDGHDFCYFGRSSNCGAIVFFGVVAWIVLSLIVIYRICCLHVDALQISWKMECIAFGCLTAVWFLVAIIVSAGNPNSQRFSAGNAVILFSWVNILLHLGLAVIAYTNRFTDEEENMK